MNSVYFIVGVATLVVILASFAWFSFSRIRHRSSASWEGLVKKLVWVDPTKVAEIALDLLDESEDQDRAFGQPGLDPSAVWDSIGGLQGLEVVKNNSRVFIELAAHLQHYYPEAVKVAEDLRMEARELEWHVERLRGAAKTGNLQVSFPEYARQAVAIYYRMSRELLDLYEAAHSPMLTALQSAL